MITHLRAQRFKSWEDTGPMTMAPLTGLFGTNSSGKTAILQLLLMLKQTVESTDRSRVLHIAGGQTYVDLGTFSDLAYDHRVPGSLSLELGWSRSHPLLIDDPQQETKRRLFAITELLYRATIQAEPESIAVGKFGYSFDDRAGSYCFGMERESKSAKGSEARYELIHQGYEVKRPRGRPPLLPPPVKCYGFPDQVNAGYQNLGFLADLVLAFEELFQRVYYLGPLREYPHRIYRWAGDQPQDVGQRGESAVPALLAANARKMKVRTAPGGRKTRLVDRRVAEWLQALDLIHSFELRPIGDDRSNYEVRLRRHSEASEVLITDVGFGVSQVLPVLVLCYYAPEGSTLILEQPEIHLHPAVQAGLADVFIDAIKTRGIQILLESHSEHLLRRLQRRVAEGAFAPEQAALYFARMDQGRSQLDRLQLDLYGNISNWPQGFFGDELGELAAMTEAAMSRQTDPQATG